MTVKEVEAKLGKLQSEMQIALEAAKVLTPATAEFDEAYGRYLAAKSAIAKIPDEVAKAKQAENAEAISAGGAQVAEGISQLVTGLNIEALLGEPVKALSYAVTAEGKKLVIFNPVTKIERKATGEKREGGKRNHILDPQGDKLNLTKFVLQFATEAEKASPEYKYPHGQVDTKPKFEAFCTAHNITGYTYVMGKS